MHFTLSLIFSHLCRCQVNTKTFLRSHQFCLTRFAPASMNSHGITLATHVNSACVNLGSHTPGVELSVFILHLHSVSILNATSPHMIDYSELSCNFDFLLHIDIYIRIKNVSHLTDVFNVITLVHCAAYTL